MKKKKEKSTEIIRLLELAGRILSIGSLDGFILAQVINTVLALEHQDKLEMCKAISYFENIGRRRDFHRIAMEELHDHGWEVKLLPREKEAAA